MVNRLKDDPRPNYKYLPKNRSDGSSFQPPVGYDIGGDAVPPHHKAGVLPVVTDPGEDDPSKFQPPRGQILGDDLPMGTSLQGVTDNALGNSRRSDLEAKEAGAGGYSTFPENPSVESLNPSLVNADEPKLPAGFCGRANGWER